MARSRKSKVGQEPRKQLALKTDPKTEHDDHEKSSENVESVEVEKRSQQLRNVIQLAKMLKKKKTTKKIKNNQLLKNELPTKKIKTLTKKKE